jgi:hypothetical protein
MTLIFWFLSLVLFNQPPATPNIVGRPCPIDAKKRRLLCLDQEPNIPRAQKNSDQVGRMRKGF